jgi:hypothetical protein
LIKDNGIGFEDQNVEAFSTSDTTYKASREGKGIGRFMWLAAFERAEIESGFRANGQMKVRRLTFCTRGKGIESAICIEAPEQDRTTTIKLLGFLSYVNAKGWIMATGLRRVDASCLLFVEPRLIGDLDVVSVRVDDVCREVVGTPFGPKAWFLL